MIFIQHMQDIQKSKQKKILFAIFNKEIEIKNMENSIAEKQDDFLNVYNDRLKKNYLIKVSSKYLTKITNEIITLKKEIECSKKDLENLKNMLLENYKKIKKYDILLSKEKASLKEELKRQEEKELQDIYTYLYNRKINTH